MEITWNSEKNELLKSLRGLDLESLAEAIRKSEVLEVVANPGHPGQVVFMILVDDYVCAVPAVPYDGGYFLKTAYTSRKFNKRFHGGD